MVCRDATYRPIISIGQSFESRRCLPNPYEDTPPYSPNHGNNQTELILNIFSVSTSFEAVNFWIIGKAHWANFCLICRSDSNMHKKGEELSGCSGVISVLTGESIESATAEVLSLGDCSRQSLSATVALVPSAETCTSPMSCRSYSKSVRR